MFKGSLTKVLALVAVFAVVVALEKSYRIKAYREENYLLRSTVTTVVKDRDNALRLLDDTLKELQRARDDHGNTLLQIQEARKNDPTIDDWLNQPIPDGLRDILR